MSTSIPKFDGTGKVSTSTLFHDTESYVLSTEPNIDRNSVDFQHKCMQHVAQRIDLSVHEIYTLFKSIDMDENPWTEFKKTFGDYFASRKANVWLEYDKLTSLKPKSVAHNDLLFQTEIKTAFAQFMKALSKDASKATLNTVIAAFKKDCLAFLIVFLLMISLPSPSKYEMSDMFNSPARMSYRNNNRKGYHQHRGARPRRDGNAWLPSADACYQCLRSGHIARHCRDRPYCPYHQNVGHKWYECRTFPDLVRQTKHELYKRRAQSSIATNFLDAHPLD
ncbi:uncharacterized protein LOC122246289 isoform X1 [Penaeus japonicus]|uniref:uncharacterized protein LOC122246289 isoform X1 n=1 Tax=Penaeus japonicus TaxID=27405 RepID=UPI001C70C3F2|nr:uncharacterized protein LOC122246289 isoform X1 [Penaeus japonicus]